MQNHSMSIGKKLKMLQVHLKSAMAKFCRTILSGAWQLTKVAGLFISPVVFWEVYAAYLFASISAFTFRDYILLENFFPFYIWFNHLTYFSLISLLCWLYLLYKTYGRRGWNLIFVLSITHVLLFLYMIENFARIGDGVRWLPM